MSNDRTCVRSGTATSSYAALLNALCRPHNHRRAEKHGAGLKVKIAQSSDRRNTVPLTNSSIRSEETRIEVTNCSILRKGGLIDVNLPNSDLCLETREVA